MEINFHKISLSASCSTLLGTQHYALHSVYRNLTQTIWDVGAFYSNVHFSCNGYRFLSLRKDSLTDSKTVPHKRNSASTFYSLPYWFLFFNCLPFPINFDFFEYFLLHIWICGCGKIEQLVFGRIQRGPLQEGLSYYQLIELFHSHK